MKNLVCRPMQSSHSEVQGQRQDLGLTELEKGESRVLQEETRAWSCLSQC